MTYGRATALSILMLILMCPPSHSFAFIQAPETARVYKDTNNALRKYLDLDWRSHGNVGKSVRDISRDDVAKMVLLLLGDDAPDLSAFKDLGVTDADLIQEMKFLDIDNDGKLDIIVVIGDVCSSCPNTIGVIKPVNGKIALFEVEDDYASLSEDLIDINQDGVFGIISRKPLNLESASAVTFVPWLDIYRWDGTNYVVANPKFKKYYATTYKNVIGALKEEAMEQSGNETYVSNLDLALERAKSIK